MTTTDINDMYEGIAQAEEMNANMLKYGTIDKPEWANHLVVSRNKREGKPHGKHGTRINRDHFKTVKRIHSASWGNANRKQKKLIQITEKNHGEGIYDTIFDCDPEYEFC